jgi:hypothetical protein
MSRSREAQDKINARRRELWPTSGRVNIRKYEKTKKGFLVRGYRNMQSRVEGVQHLKAHLYVGKSLLSREAFYDWALNHSPEFHSLFEVWESSGYDRRLTPSVDRVESSKGYELGNMEWVTHSENSRRGSLSRASTPSYKLSDDNLLAIRQAYGRGGWSMQRLGDLHKVSSATVFKVVHFKYKTEVL